jgi:hypothetical protein|tara:strand:+ start:1097 stop:1498 length:402 start_codon:yes stop_codon:yes gene_type:complete
MTEEFAKRQMTQEQTMRLNEVSDDAYRGMKERQDQTKADLQKAAEDRIKYPEMVIPTDEAIKGMNKDFEMTHKEMGERADEIGLAVVNREAKEAERAKQQSKGQDKSGGQDGFLSRAREKRDQVRTQKRGHDR